MREVKFADQPLHAVRFLQRIQVFALDVFNQRHRERRVIGHLLDDDRHFVQAGHGGRAHATLTGDDFVAVTDGAHENRLHDALRLDRFGQLAQGFGVHLRARLVFAGP